MFTSAALLYNGYSSNIQNANLISNKISSSFKIGFVANSVYFQDLGDPLQISQVSISSQYYNGTTHSVKTYYSNLTNYIFSQGYNVAPIYVSNVISIKIICYEDGIQACGMSILPSRYLEIKYFQLSSIVSINGKNMTGYPVINGTAYVPVSTPTYSYHIYSPYDLISGNVSSSGNYTISMPYFVFTQMLTFLTKNEVTGITHPIVNASFRINDVINYTTNSYGEAKINYTNPNMSVEMCYKCGHVYSSINGIYDIASSYNFYEYSENTLTVYFQNAQKTSNVYGGITLENASIGYQKSSNISLTGTVLNIPDGNYIINATEYSNIVENMFYKLTTNSSICIPFNGSYSTPSNIMC